MCFGEGPSLTLTISGWDPANPLEQDVVFWKETAETATGMATLWVAWDFLATQWGRQDVITCEQLEYLQGQMDHIVATDVEYFGDYVQRPAGNDNIDVMIYNIVDEGYFVDRLSHLHRRLLLVEHQRAVRPQHDLHRLV